MKTIYFTDYTDEKCLLNRSEDTIIYTNHSGFMAVASVDNENAYRIEIIEGSNDAATLKHFVKFLESRGLYPEEYIA